MSSEDCVELRHDAQRIFEPVSLPIIPTQMIQQMMSSMGVPPIIRNLVPRLMMPTLPMLQVNKVSVDDLPKSQCVWIPHAPNANIIRIIGHYNGEKKTNPRLIISSTPINCNQQQPCSEICANKTEEECICVDEDEPITSFDALNGREKGFEQTAVWVTSHVDGGKKYIKTCSGDIGFQVFSMFTNVINHGNPTKRKINNLKIASQHPAHTDLMHVGGKSVKNILVHHLNDNVNSFIPPQPTFTKHKFGHKDEIPGSQTHKLGRKGEMAPPIHKVNLIVQLNKDETEVTKDVPPQIQMTVLPLIHEASLQYQYIQHCTINQANPEQCSVYIRGDFDYDIRFVNTGGAMSDINVFTLEIPTNDEYIPAQHKFGHKDEMPVLVDTPSTSQAAVSTPETRQPPLTDGLAAFDYTQQEDYPLVDTDIPETPEAPSPVFNIVVVTAIIIISLIGLFSVLRSNRKRRKAKAKQAYVDNNGEILVDEVSNDSKPSGGDYKRLETPEVDTIDTPTQTPFVSMDEYQLSYHVFSVPTQSL